MIPKIFIQEITTCSECPNCEITDFGKKLICGELSRMATEIGQKYIIVIVDGVKIPSDCPLPNGAQ